MVSRNAFDGTSTWVRVARALRVLVVLVALPLGFASSALAAETGQIAGTVTDTSIHAIEGIEVCAYEQSPEGIGEGFGCTTTDSNGEYTISGLTSGEYKVEFSSPFNSTLNYIAQYYDGKSSASEATAVPVAAGSTTRNIDAELKEGGRVKGKVTDASSKEVIAGIEVCAFSASTESVGCARTDSGGEYTVSGLASGEYKVEFSASFSGELNFITQYYDGKSSASEAAAVSVTAGSTTPGIDAELKAGGQIVGRVTDVSTNAAIAGVFVCVFEAGGGISLGGCALTDSNGEYTISGLASGDYRIGFSDGHKYIAQYYSGKSSLAEAGAVSVIAGSVTQGIDAAMQPVVVDASPVNTTPPVVSGTPAVGGALRCANGLWTGNPPPTFTDTWLRDGVPIAGAIGSSYGVQSIDAGHILSCEVTGTNTLGEKSVTSTGVSIPGIYINTGPPRHGRVSASLTPLVTITESRIVVSKGSVAVRLKCRNATCRGSVELTIRVVKKHHGGKKIASRREILVLAKGSFSVTQGTSATVVLHLTAAGRKRLAHAKRHPATAEIVLSVNGAKTTAKSVLVR
jgi:hypothetical protein